MRFSEIWHDYWSPHEAIDTSPKVSDEVKYTTCYMCACRCGIKVHMKDGAIRYIEGNPKHPVNRGVMCGKGASGIMQQQSPAKLRKPLMRVGERGSGEFREIEWDEAIATAVNWLSRIRAEDPKKLAFFTGRDQSQSMTGFWATQFGTPNFAAHGGFCSVNMAAAGMYTIGGSFWEFGEPDWERTHLFLMFGVAEDHDSNPIKIALSGLRRRGAKFISVNPVWTWNAIGKRSGAWNLAADSPEFTRGFLLNHLITEMLPENDGDAGANADPITGQAAWYDLRVRVEKALPAEAGDSAPRFPAMARLPSLMPPPSLLRYGARHESDEPQERAP